MPKTPPTGRVPQGLGARLRRQLGRGPTATEILREAKRQIADVKISEKTRQELPPVVRNKDKPL